MRTGICRKDKDYEEIELMPDCPTGRQGRRI